MSATATIAPSLDPADPASSSSGLDADPSAATADAPATTATRRARGAKRTAGEAAAWGIAAARERRAGRAGARRATREGAREARARPGRNAADVGTGGVARTPLARASAAAGAARMEIIVCTAPTLSTGLRMRDGVGRGEESAGARGSDVARRAPAQRRLEDRLLKEKMRRAREVETASRRPGKTARRGDSQEASRTGSDGIRESLRRCATARRRVRRALDRSLDVLVVGPLLVGCDIRAHGSPT